MKSGKLKKIFDEEKLMIKKEMICKTGAVLFAAAFMMMIFTGCSPHNTTDHSADNVANSAVSNDPGAQNNVDGPNDDATISAETGCPFSDLTWASTTDDMIAAEGDDHESYDSIYKGMTYTYPKTYLENEGIIKYMFDGDGKLCNISWSYAGETADDVLKVYRVVCDDTEKLHGEGTDDNGVGNYCRMWKREEGTIMVNAVITNDSTVMQIAYMSAEVSHQ